MSPSTPTPSESTGASRGRVLVTGASIAGPAVAYWLAEAGYDVTVLERVDGQREGGQNIDVRKLAREVLDRMQLHEAVLAANTGEVGTRFVDAEGGTVSEFPASQGESDGPTAELEILRGELARILIDACGEDITWWSGDQVESLDQDDDAVTVRLAGGDEHTFDLLVVAEGAGSRTRGLVMRGADEPELRRLGMYITWTTIPRTPDDDRWWRWMTVPGSRQVSLRPDNVGTTRVMLGFLSDPLGFDGWDHRRQLEELRRRFGDLEWEVPRVLDAIADGADLYAEDLTQVVSPTWSRGRVVLLGDAAWCVTPIGGAGTSLALVGAYVLAAQLSQLEAGSPPSAAFDAFERWMRPLVEEAQDLPPGTPRLAAPESRLGVAVFRAGSKLAASRPVQAVVDKLSSGPGPDADRPLPELRRP